METCLLVDGYSLAFRAFYALPLTLTNSSGQPTNALHGFSKMLASLIERYRPEYLAVALDYPAPTFRDALLASYKGQRPSTPEELKAQLEILRPLVRSLGVSVIEREGYEADDIVATLATQARDRGLRTYIVTGDRDSFQLVEDPLVSVLYNRRGVSEIDLMDEAAVTNKTGVPPSKYPHLAALRGDPSDNLPGVPGIGDKTAAKLIQTYGSIQEMFDTLEALPERQRVSLKEYKAQVELNLKMTMMVRDVPLDTTLDAIRVGPWDPNSAEKTFLGLDLRGAYGTFLKVFASRSVLDAGSDNSVDTPKEHIFEELEISTTKELAAGAATTFVDFDLKDHSRDVLSYLAISDGKKYAVLRFAGGNFDLEATRSALKALLSPVTGASLKSLLRVLGVSGLPEIEVGLDMTIAEFLIDPGSRGLTLEAIASRHLGEVLESDEHNDSLFDRDMQRSDEEIAHRLGVLMRLVEPLDRQLTLRGLTDLYYNIEAPLSKVLARMEVRGVGVDVEMLKTINADLKAEGGELLQQIRGLTRSDLNPNSPQQLAKVLFEDLKLPSGKKTKTGYSTDAKVLEKLRGIHPVVELILAYREVDKLRSTFAEGLLQEVAPDGRIHATFSQTVARTGRISSDSPNLHNIPIRSERGKRFREVFVAPPGYLLVVADYSQIELRVIAHLSGDENLVAALTSDHDVHSETAAMVFGIDIKDVTLEQRAKAKMVAYGLAYGMEAYGLAQRLNISTSEAEEILISFFKAFPKVKSYTEKAVEEARVLGYTKTLFGRRRYFPDLNSPNRSLKMAAERQAMNAGIQGLAADIFKIALLRVEERLSSVDARLILQIHDEVVVESEVSIASEIVQILEDSMTNSAELIVPLVVNVGIGKRWSDAK